MDKSIRVQVKEPCHENWQNMTENEKGRFCGSCQKTVVDFTLMSDKQILDHLSKATGKTCGRFANDQLDRELKAKVVKPKSKWAYFINLLIPIVFTSSGGNTKGEPRLFDSKSAKLADSDDPNYGVLGMISPRICYEQKPNDDFLNQTRDTLIEEKLTIVGDLSLEPIIRIPDTIPAVDTAAIVVDTNRFIGDTTVFDNNFPLAIPKQESCTTIRLGGIGFKPEVVEEKTPVIDFFKDSLAAIGLKKLIKAYPNPVIAGQSVTIDFSPKTLGIYNVELFDINGRMIYSRQLNMVFKKQSFQVPTISSWSKGTYIIRITGEGKDNVNNVKVMVR